MATIYLDLDRYDKYIKDVDKLCDGFMDALQDGIDELQDRTYDKLVENINKYGLGESNLASNLQVTQLPEGLLIICDTDYAVYLEYGTGMTGSSNPHPHPSFGEWVYNSELEGWWYPTTESDPNSTKKRASDGSWIAFTRGHPSRPFLYDTWLWASRSAYNIIMKHLRKLQ